MFDGVADTCWNSDQGSPQSIMLDFLSAGVTIEKIDITFQGGFVGQEALIEVGESLDSLIEVQTLYNILDNNDKQCFPLASSPTGRYLKITFPTSTDFYGRVTIYDMEVYGQKS